VGLARIEFIIANQVKIHPKAAIEYKNLPAKIKKEIEKITQDKVPKDFYVETLARSLSQIAASFYPREVIIRFSDFKTNEYRSLIGGEIFENVEDNPMLGFRGAMRYVDPDFKECFSLECAAIRYLIEKMQLDNITLLIPFVRTPEELKEVIALLKKEKLDQLKRSMMIELPANLFDFEEFVLLVDGFSIGSNDLFQMSFGADRDSEKLATYINETNPAFLEFCKLFIEKAKKHKKEIGICGQATSDFKEVRDFLIKVRISYISLNSDAVLKFISQDKA
jgi:pyruvate,water dikinase